MSSPTYNRMGLDYSDFRQPDPRIETAIWEALGNARSVVNVGAGAGSYEPSDREVIAVEPSPVMIAQRPPEAEKNSEIWTLSEYFPEAMALERELMTSIESLEASLPGATIATVPAPSHCRDEFTSALWDRPERFLDPDLLRGSSLWHRLSSETIERGQEHLRADLQSGAWDERHGHLRTRAELDIGLRLVCEEL